MPGLIETYLHFRGFGILTSKYTDFKSPDVTGIPGFKRMLVEVSSTTHARQWIKCAHMVLSENPIPTKERH